MRSAVWELACRCDGEVWARAVWRECGLLDRRQLGQTFLARSTPILQMKTQAQRGEVTGPRPQASKRESRTRT